MSAMVDPVWPDDPKGYVFLARAIEAIGKAAVPAWDGRELHAAISPRPAPPLQVSKAPPPIVPIGGPIRPRAPASFEIQSADSVIPLATQVRLLAKANADREAYPGRIARFREVTTGLKRAFEAGDLVCFIRPVIGGAMTAGDAVWWNTELADLRFLTFRLDRGDPFRGRGGDPHWLFLSADSLLRYIDPDATAAAAPEEPFRRVYAAPATYAEMENAFIAYMEEEQPCTNAADEQTRLEERTGKRFKREQFREIRSRLATVPLDRGRKATPLNYARRR